MQATTVLTEGAPVVHETWEPVQFPIGVLIKVVVPSFQLNKPASAGVVYIRTSPSREIPAYTVPSEHTSPIVGHPVGPPPA